MYQKFFITFFLIIFLIGCGKKENLNVKPPDENEAYKICSNSSDYETYYLFF